MAVPSHAASAGLARTNPATLTFRRGGCSSTRLAHWPLECSAQVQHNMQSGAHQPAGCGKVTRKGPSCGRRSAPRALSASPYRPASGWPCRRRLAARHHCTRSFRPRSFKRVHHGSRRRAAANPRRSSCAGTALMRRCRRTCAMRWPALTAAAAPAAALDAVATLSPTPGPEAVVITPWF